MNNVKIKLKAERVGEYEVRHHIIAPEGVAVRLPAAYAKKDIDGFSIFRADNDEVIFRGWNRKYGNDLPKLKDVREWVIGYDARVEAAEWNEILEEAYEENKWVDLRRLRAKANAAYKLHVNPKRKYAVGDRAEFKFAHLNKNCTIGEYANEVAEGAYDVQRVKVVNVVELSNEEYDRVVENLMDRYDWIKGGGANSDAPEIKAVETFAEIDRDPKLKEIWFATYYLCVDVVCAPNRVAFAVDGSGHDYCRYVGIQ